MISNTLGQRVLYFLRQQSGNKSRWAIVFSVALLGVFLSTSARAATFTVNIRLDDVDADPGNGICATSDGVCTLRAAIEEANALPGADHQIILPPNDYVLSIVSALAINSDLTITGGGASTTVIDGNKTLRPNARVFVIGFGSTVNISGVTIRNASTNGFGGGISNTGTLTLTNSTVSGNTAAIGGGIENSFGKITLVNSTVSENNATQGGGILNSGATLMLINTTVNGNTANVQGGGIWSAGLLTLTNSTVSGNNSNVDGGGIWNGGTVNLYNATITNNRADADLDGVGIGGGVLSTGVQNIATFQNTIIAGNRESRFDAALGTWVSTFRDCAGTLISNGNNMMRNVNCTVSGAAPILDTAPFGPLLGPLQNNGGRTQIHALLAGSPAIDAGNPTGCRDNLGTLLQTDQRGFRRTVDGNRDGSSRCDIGAVEFGSGHGVRFYSDVDFDGDGRNDIAIYRDGSWFIIRSFDGNVTSTGWGGLPQDIPVPGDYDGDGKTDVAVYRDGAQSGTQALWFIRRSSDGGTSVFQWGGLLQDVPVPGDYDGDGKTDVAVYRNGTWLIVRSFDGGVTGVGWGGLPQDIPVPADYDGDGRTDFAVYRDGMWFILLANGGVIGTGWGGLPQDVPVPGDYDGDGKTDLAVYRDGSWFVLRSSDGGVTMMGWGGLLQDVAVPGDYDGDRKTDVAIYRDGSWYIVRSSDGGVTSTGWGGLPQDIPLSRRND